MKNIFRYDIFVYLNISKTKEQEEYELMGPGFNKIDESPGAKTDSTCYVHEKTSTSTITQYESKFAYEAEAMADNRSVMDLYNTGRNHETGLDAERDIVVVDLYDPVAESDGTYQARKFRVANNVDSYSGNGGEKIKVSGSLEAVGDPIQGTFNVKTKTFTEKEASA